MHDVPMWFNHTTIVRVGNEEHVNIENGLFLMIIPLTIHN